MKELTQLLSKALEAEFEKSSGRKQLFCQMNFWVGQFMVLLYGWHGRSVPGMALCSGFFIPLPIAILFIMLLFKYSCVVGLPLLLQCLSVHHFKKEKKERIVLLGHSDQSNPGKTTEFPHEYYLY